MTNSDVAHDADPTIPLAAELDYARVGRPDDGQIADLRAAVTRLHLLIIELTHEVRALRDRADPR